MAVYLYDTFTDAANTSLTLHTGEIGATWTRHPSTPFGAFNISDANRARVVAAEDLILTASGVPGSANQEITATVLALSEVTGHTTSLYGMMSDTVNTGYEARVSTASGNMYVGLYKHIDGAKTSLGPLSSPFPLNTDTIIKLELGDGIQKIYINGVLGISGTDTAITAPGRFGIGGIVSTTNTTGIHIDSITGEDFAVASGATATLGTPSLALTTSPITASVGAGPQGATANLVTASVGITASPITVSVATPPPVPAYPPAYTLPVLTTTVRINGVVTPVRSLRTRHGVDQPVGTATVTIRAPKPLHAEIGSRVTIHAGYDGAALPIFTGRVADYDGQFSEQGGEIAINADGNGAALMDKHEVTLGVQGPIRWFSWWRSICDYDDVPNYWADEVEDVDGVWLYRGDNSAIHGGLVLIRTNTSPGQEMARTARLVGYRHYETATHVRLSRVSGLPTKPLAELDTFSEGVNCRSVRRGESISDIANYWDVYGATYTATDGSEVALRSFPAVVNPNPLFGPNGIRREEIRDVQLDTIDLADASRNTHEVDYTEPSSVWTWTTRGRPDIHPGDQTALLSQKVGPQIEVSGSVISFPVALWVMSVEHRIGPQGWETAMTGWSGAGTPLPAGNDCTTISLLGSEGRHLGDEYLSHYRRPTPDGTTVTLPFTVPNLYTTLTIRGLAHGTNSYLTNTETNVSRFEIWQGGERATEQGELPYLAENLAQQYPYNDGRVLLEDGSMSGNADYFWSPIVIPLSGSLNAGAAELRIISGSDTGFDDFEVCNLVLQACGIGSPALVGVYTL